MKINNVHITVDVEEWFHTNWFDVPEVIKKHCGGIYPKTDVLRTTEKFEDFKMDILRFKNEICDAKGFRFPNFSYSTEKLSLKSF